MNFPVRLVQSFAFVAFTASRKQFEGNHPWPDELWPIVERLLKTRKCAGGNL
jgi:hypothetical protein